MPWIEEKSGIKFMCWGKLKDSLDKEDAVVLKEGESLQGKVEHVEFEMEDGEIKAYKFKVKTKEFEEPVLVWSNAAIFRQQQKLKVQQGEEVRFTYNGTYKAKNGKTGHDVTLAVNRK